MNFFIDSILRNKKGHYEKAVSPIGSVEFVKNWGIDNNWLIKDQGSSIFILYSSVKLRDSEKGTEENLQELLDFILGEMTRNSKCIVFFIDKYYRRFVQFNLSELRGLSCYSVIFIDFLVYLSIFNNLQILNSLP